MEWNTELILERKELRNVPVSGRLFAYLHQIQGVPQNVSRAASKTNILGNKEQLNFTLFYCFVISEN